MSYVGAPLEGRRPDPGEILDPPLYTIGSQLPKSKLSPIFKPPKFYKKFQGMMWHAFYCYHFLKC